MKLKNTRASMKNHYLRIKEKQAPKTFFLSKPKQTNNSTISHRQ